MKIYDLTPEITEEIAVFPGDTPFKSTSLMSMDDGHHLGLDSITTTCHLGAHADGPKHYKVGGQGIGARPLDLYLGPCEVISVGSTRNKRVGLKDLPTGFKPSQKRVLFKTQSFPDPNRWSDDFIALSKEVVEFLAASGVRLIGIDTPSLDPSGDKNLDCHRAIAENDMGILEGLILKEVPDGIYLLVALPLKISHGDASPVRAVLVGGDVWKSFK